MQQSKAIPIVIAVYALTFGRIFELVDHSFLTMALIIVAGIWLLVVKRTTVLKDNSELVKPAFVFFFGMAGIQFLQVTLGRISLHASLDHTFSFLMCAAITAYLYGFKTERRLRIIGQSYVLLGACFVLQFLLSFYESYLGTIIGAGKDDLIVGMSTDSIPLLSQIAGAEVFYHADILHARFMGNALWPHMSQTIFPWLSIPFSGLLGQHNYWGEQLPFLNIIFLLWHYIRRGRLNTILLWLIVVAALMNTSRFSLTAILVCDVMFLWFQRPQWRKFLTTFAVMGGIFILAVALSSVIPFFMKNDTLSGRLSSWPLFLSFYIKSDILSLLFGFGSEQMVLVNKAMSFISVENEVLATILNFGAVGCVLCCLTAYKLYRIARASSGAVQLFFSIICVAVVLVSFPSDLLFHYSVLVPLTLVLVQLTSLSEMENAFGKQRARATFQDRTKGVLQ